MGLFNRKKKLCLACGEKTGAMRAGLEIEGGWLCRNCKEKLSPFVEQLPINPFKEGEIVTPITMEEYRAHLAWREECKALDSVFVPTEHYKDFVNDEQLLEIDRTNGLFRVLRTNGQHADVMRLADLRDVHPVIVEYIYKEGEQGSMTRTWYYYFNMRIGMDAPLMQRAEFVACAWYVPAGMGVGKRTGGYRPGEQTTMKEENIWEYERRLEECQKLAQVFTGQAGPPELRVTEELPSQDRCYRVGTMPGVNKFGPQIR